MYELVPVASRDLQARLLPHVFDGFARTSLRPLFQRYRQFGQFHHGLGVPLFQLLSLLPPDSRHERQMIVPTPLLVALPEPPAHVAMLHRFRIRWRLRGVVSLLECQLTLLAAR